MEYNSVWFSVVFVSDGFVQPRQRSYWHEMSTTRFRRWRNRLQRVFTHSRFL